MERGRKKGDGEGEGEEGRRGKGRLEVEGGAKWGDWRDEIEN